MTLRLDLAQPTQREADVADRSKAEVVVGKGHFRAIDRFSDMSGRRVLELIRHFFPQGHVDDGE